MRKMLVSAIAVIVGLGFLAGAAQAQGVPGVDVNKCLAGKTKCVNKKAAGLLKCREKCQKNPAKCGSVQTDCEAKVRAKFDGGTKGVAYSCFGKLELKDDGVTPERICTTSGDLAAMEAKADAFVADVVGTLEGSPPPACGDGVVNGAESCDGADLGGASCAGLGFASGTLACSAGCCFDTSGCTPYPAPTCGNGAIEVPESCDGTDVGGATCASLGFASGTLGCTAGCGYDVSGCACAAVPTCAYPATGQTTCWARGPIIPCAGTGHDGEIQAGAPLAYQDNGDGTVTDLNTGLMWEKKSDDGSINDKAATYTWDNAFAVHVAGLNSGGGFASYTDWRVPNYKELVSILNLENSNPAVSPAFNNNCAPGCTVLTCSCTAPGGYSFYWSSSTRAGNSVNAWIVNFSTANQYDSAGKENGLYVRAVRGGS